MADIAWKDQYKHPLWQKKRLDVMQANDFACQLCGDKTETLNVHHKTYIKGRKIWDYEVSQLECLCETCHATTHQCKDILAAFLLLLPSSALPSITALIAGYCSGVTGLARIELSPDQVDAIASNDPMAFASGRIGAAARAEHFIASKRCVELSEVDF